MDAATDRPSLWRHLAVLCSTAFLLNWPWELLVIPNYAVVRDWPWLSAAAHCTVATAGDAVVTLAIYGVGALASGRPRWGVVPRWNVYATASLLGGLTAAALEWRALATGRWSYSDLMPIVPGFRVGLWPLLQLPLLVPAAFWVSAFWGERSRSRTRSDVAE